MAPHCSPLAWNISGRRSLVGCSPWVAKSQAQLSDFPFTFHFHALEKAMATHSSVLAWRIPGTGEPAGLPSWGRTQSDSTELTWQQQHASQVAIVVKNLSASAGDVRDTGSVSGLGRSPGGEHGNPFQYSCLKNPMGRGAWQATAHSFAKSWTQLK